MSFTIPKECQAVLVLSYATQYNNADTSFSEHKSVLNLGYLTDTYDSYVRLSIQTYLVNLSPGTFKINFKDTNPDFNKAISGASLIILDN